MRGKLIISIIETLVISNFVVDNSALKLESILLRDINFNLYRLCNYRLNKSTDYNIIIISSKIIINIVNQFKINDL